MQKYNHTEQLSLDQKIKKCRQVMIINLQKTIKHKMFYQFLVNKDITSGIKSFYFKSETETETDLSLGVLFHDYKNMIRFYEQFNFQQKILSRKFNISLVLDLKQNEIKQVFLNGLTEENQKAVFDAARKIGICKLNALYQNDELKSQGFLSFCRVQQLSDGQLNQLKNDLKAINVQITSEKENSSVFQKPNGYKEKIQQKVELKEQQRQQKLNNSQSIISMPQAKLLVGQREFSITFRSIPIGPKSVLVIPFQGDSLNLYPGEQIELDEISNNKKLPYQLKTLAVNSVSTQIKHDSQDQISQIKIFTRIGKKSNTIQKTVENIIISVESLKKQIKWIENLTIPLSILTHNPQSYSDLIHKMISFMKARNTFIKRVNLTASNIQEWNSALKAFYQTTTEMIQNEQIKF